MEPQWGGEKSLKAAEKDHTLTDRVCAFKTSWAECRDQKRCRHRANGGDFSLDIHSYRTTLRCAIWPLFSSISSNLDRSHSGRALDLSSKRGKGLRLRHTNRPPANFSLTC